MAQMVRLVSPLLLPPSLHHHNNTQHATHRDRDRDTHTETETERQRLLPVTADGDGKCAFPPIGRRAEQCRARRAFRLPFLGGFQPFRTLHNRRFRVCDAHSSRVRHFHTQEACASVLILSTSLKVSRRVLDERVISSFEGEKTVF